MRTESLRTPSLRRHKASCLGVVTLNGKELYLGHWPAGQKNPPEAVRLAYDRLIGEWLANGRRLQPVVEEDVDCLSVNELILAFWQHAEQHYRRADGTLTNEMSEYRGALKPLKELYGTLPVADFGPLKLKAVRQRMADARRYRVRIAENGQKRDRWVWEQCFRRKENGCEALWGKNWHPVEVLSEKKALARGVINKRISRIVHMFKWGLSEELIPETVYRALAAVRGLERGRTEARDTEPVKPVAAEIVEATLPHMLPPVRAMAELQIITGMRPGETCALRACDLDMTGDVWLYRLAHHKTRHKGKDRVVAIGPRGQGIIKPFLRLDTQAYLFSPRDAMAALRDRQRAARKTRVQPSQQDRRKRKIQKQPGYRYTTASYGHAVAKAIQAAHKAAACQQCKRLKPQERCEDCKAAAIPHWHPHQLRHTHATEVRRRFGLEAAQVALGHSQAQITEVYAERDLTLAAKVAQEIG